MNENKYFLINRGDLDDRLDPFYYRPQFKNAIESLGKRKRISLISKFVIHPPEYPRTYSESGYQLIRSQNVRPTGLDIKSNPVYFSEETLKNKRKIKPTIGDLLVVRSGVNAGDASIVEQEYPDCIVGADTLMARFKETVNPKFIQVFFATNLGKLILSRYITGATNKHVSPHSFNKIEIPTLDFTFQQLAVDKFEKGLDEKNKGEKKSAELLKQIDTKILEELIINLPVLPPNTIENRMFKTGWQKVTGNRFDPKKYSKQSEDLIACIENSPVRKVPLKSLVVHSVAGDWGLDEKEAVNPKLFTKCLVVRATEFDNNYNLNIENSRAKFRFISNVKLKKLDIKPKDFLLEKSGGSPDQPVGRISILENELLENNTIGYSNFIQKFRVDTEQVLPEYLFCFLKTIHNIKLTDVMQSQTNGIRNLIMREYWNQSIILPDKKKQKEVADTIYQMRAEAKQTEIDAQQGFEQTKKEIEKLILE